MQTLPKALENPGRDGGRLVEQLEEATFREHEQSDSRGCSHRRRTRHIRHQRHLTNEVASAKIAHLLAIARHAQAALHDHEELSSPRAFADQRPALTEVDLVRKRCNPPEVRLRAACEERYALQQLQLGVSTELHRIEDNAPAADTGRGRSAERAGRLERADND